MHAKKAGLPTIGAGENLAQAQKLFIQEVNGIKIAIAEYEFNQSQNGGGAAPLDPIDNYQQIQQAKAQADIVIVTLNGRNEYYTYPGLRKIFKYYIDLGVAAVICHPPHVPGTYEYYQGKPIVYLLGNFIFDNIKSPKDWGQGYMVQLNISAEGKPFELIELIPYKHSVELGGVELLTGEEKTQFFKRIGTYREKLEDAQVWLQEWNDFVISQADNYIMRQFSPVTFRGLGMLARNTPIAKLSFNKPNSLGKLNMLRCQSHRELLTAVLEFESQARND